MSLHTYAWQQTAWKLSREAIARGAHALLVAGARGSGKRDFALALAASKLCASPLGDGRACSQCESCRWIAAGTHPDFALVEPNDDDEGDEAPGGGPAIKRSRFITVDQVRQLSALLSLTAHRAAGKVIVMQPAEALNVAASNALLKSLEEPPAGALFLLVSHRPALLLPTVRSRCQLVPIRIDDQAAVSQWLAANTSAEDPSLLLALAGGAPLEAVAIGSQPDWTRRAGFLRALNATDVDPVRLAETYRDLTPALVLSWLQTWTFDVVQTRYAGRPRYHRDLEALVERTAEASDPVAVTRFHRRLLALQRHVHHPLNARLLLESLLIAYCEAVSAGEDAR